MSRPRGTGSIRRVAGGWQARLPGRDRTPLGVFATPEEAERVLAGALHELADGSWTAPNAATVREYGERVIERRERDGVRGARQERSVWRSHLCEAPFADRPLASITPRDLHDWLRALRDRPARLVVRGGRDEGSTTREAQRTLSRQSQRHARRLLVTILDAAVVDGIVAENVAREVRLPRHLRAGEQARVVAHEWLRADEVARVLGCDAIPEVIRLELSVRIHQALRPGEAAGLRWSDLVLEGAEPTMRIARSYDGPVKDDEVRTIPLLPASVAALERLRELRPPPRGRPHALVFPASSGAMRARDDDLGWSDRPWRDRAGTRHVRPGWRSLAGVDRHVTVYGLRHTGGTHLAAGTWGRTWALHELRRFMGHSSVTVTQRYVDAASTLHEAARATVGGARVASPTTDPSGHGRGTDGTRPRARSRESSYFSGARPAGLEPATRGLEGADEASEVAALGSAVPRPCPDPWREAAGAAADAIDVAVTAIAEGEPHAVRRLLEAAMAGRDLLREAVTWRDGETRRELARR